LPDPAKRGIVVSYSLRDAVVRQALLRGQRRERACRVSAIEVTNRSAPAHPSHTKLSSFTIHKTISRRATMNSSLARRRFDFSSAMMSILASRNPHQTGRAASVLGAWSG
jgi:hypothetical protein